MHFSLVLKVTLFTVLVPGAATLYFPYILLSGSGSDLQSASLALAIPAYICILMGTAIYLRCAWDFAVKGLGTPAPIDPPKNLVVSGLYRWVRNPMYQGILMIILGECLLFPDRGLLIYTALFALMFHVFVVFYEEPILRSRFGAPLTMPIATKCHAGTSASGCLARTQADCTNQCRIDNCLNAIALFWIVYNLTSPF